MRKTYCSIDITYLLFEEYLQEKKTSVCILKPCQEKGQVYEEVSLLRT